MKKRSVSSRDIIKVLEGKGWVLVETRGSHQQFKHPTLQGRATVPHPKKDLPWGTVRSIMKQAQLTEDDF